MLLDVTPGTFRPETLVSLPPEENAAGLTWSTDGTAIGFGAQCFKKPSCPGSYLAIRALDLAARSVRTIRRIEGLGIGGPLTWDRRNETLALTRNETGQRGTQIVSVLLLREDGIVRSNLTLESAPHFVTAKGSPGDGRIVLVDTERTALRVYEGAQATDFAAASSDTILDHELRPGGRELLVLLAATRGSLVSAPIELRIERWDAAGRMVLYRTRTQLTQLFIPELWMRYDGSALAIVPAVEPDGYALIEVATGRRTPMPEWTGGTSVRVR